METYWIPLFALGIPSARILDSHSPIDGNHGDAQQRYANVSILNEGNELAQDLAVRPRALNKSKGIEGQHNHAEDEVGQT